MAEKATDKQRGRPFKPGQSGNPAGKARGTRNRATMAAQALIDGKAKEVVEKALSLALGGDGPILKAILDRLCPPRKDSPISLADLPKIENAEDLPKATTAIMEAVAKGHITPSEGQALAGLVESHRKVLEIVNIEARVPRWKKGEAKMNVKARLDRLEDNTATTGAARGTIADWALEHVLKVKAQLAEGRVGEIMRKLGIALDPAQDEADTIREARYLTETYPTREACQRGEAKRAARIHSLLAPRFERTPLPNQPELKSAVPSVGGN